MTHDTSEPAVSQAKLVHEQVFAMLQNAASGAMNVFAEPEAVIVTIGWDPSLGDNLPTGFMISRKGEKIGPDVVLRAVRQLSRMQEILLRSLDRQLAQRQQIIEQQEKAANERKERDAQKQ